MCRARYSSNVRLKSRIFFVGSLGGRVLLMHGPWLFELALIILLLDLRSYLVVFDFSKGLDQRFGGVCDKEFTFFCRCSDACPRIVVRESGIPAHGSPQIRKIRLPLLIAAVLVLRTFHFDKVGPDCQHTRGLPLTGMLVA